MEAGRSIITAPPARRRRAPAPQHDPATYVAFAKQFATLATEILDTAGLPAISIGIDSGDPTGASDGFWTMNVLTDGAEIGFVPGFISDHIYMQQPGPESDSGLLEQHGFQCRQTCWIGQPATTTTKRC